MFQMIRLRLGGRGLFHVTAAGGQWESCKLELRATSYPGYRQCPPYLSLSNTQIFKKKIKSIRLEAFPRDVKVPTGWMR